jgi:hypothetical protein
MGMSYYTESSLGTSAVYKGINETSTGKSAQDKAIDLIKNAQKLSNTDIEAAYIQVKMITDTLTMAAVKAFNEGKVVLLYNNVASLSTSQALPFMTVKTSRGYVTYVFMDKWIKIGRDGVMNLSAPILRDLLIGATISNGLRNNYDNLVSNVFLQRLLMDIYCQFVLRIINREFSIMSDKLVLDDIRYVINKFFLIHIFGTKDDPDTIEKLAVSTTKSIDQTEIMRIKGIYDQINPTTVMEMLNTLKEFSPRLKTIAWPSFISDWINYYYVPSMLATDTIDYLIFMVLTLLSGNNIISIAASDIVKEAKGIKNFRGELLKLV